MKRSKLAVAVVIILLCVTTGCKEKDRGDYEVRLVENNNVIVPNGNTVSSVQRNKGVEQLIAEADHSNDNKEEVDELNNLEEKQVNMDSEIEESIQKVVDSIGGEGYVIVEDVYSDVGKRNIIAEVTNSTVLILAIVDEDSRQVEAECNGSINGTDYAGLVGTDKITDISVIEVEMAVSDYGIYDVCTILEKTEEGYVISDFENEYLLHVSDEGITIEMIE